MQTISAASMMVYARKVASWPMSDVIDYLAENCVEVLDYPADAGTEEMRITDDANRRSLIVCFAGLQYRPETDAAADRALDAARARMVPEGSGVPATEFNASYFA
jgi:hypothetical protein